MLPVHFYVAPSFQMTGINIRRMENHEQTEGTRKHFFSFIMSLLHSIYGDG